MYFLTYNYKGKESIGILNNDRNKIVPMDTIFKLLGKEAPRTMNEFIDMCDEEMIESIRAKVNEEKLEEIPKENVKICAPIPFPKRNIICLGKNYLDHAMETTGISGGTDDIPKFPIYFTKIADPAIGDGEVIKSHSDITDELDYEVELAIIIGKDGINILEEEAEDYIFGYTIINDACVRDIQMRHGQWFKGKSLETHCPMGPHIVYKSEIKFPVELDIKCKVNGEIRQNSNTKQFIFNIPHVISDLSKGMRLRAGDIIITGTPAGVGLGFKPPKYLSTGDIVECYIEKIGTLTNKIE